MLTRKNSVEFVMAICICLLSAIVGTGCSSFTVKQQLGKDRVFFSRPNANSSPGIYFFGEPAGTNVITVYQTGEDSAEIRLSIVNRFAEPVFLRLDPHVATVTGASIENNLESRLIGSRIHVKGRTYVLRDSLPGNRFVLLNGQEKANESSDGYNAYGLRVPIGFLKRLTNALPAPSCILHIDIRACYYTLDGMRYTAKLYKDSEFNLKRAEK